MERVNKKAILNTGVHMTAFIFNLHMNITL